VLNDSLSVNEFLGQESSGSNHSEASVLEFLGLEDLEFLGVFGLESKRIEADVTRGVVGTEKTGLVDRDILGLDPSDGGTLLFTGTNGDGQKHPEGDRNLGKVGDGGSRNLGVEEEGASLNGLTGKETDGGEHGNTSVGELGFTVSLEGRFVGLSQVPVPFWMLLTIAIGASEQKRATIGWVEPKDVPVDKPGLLRADYTPGDIGFDPLGLKPEDPEEFKILQTKELQNGRLAMIAAAGFLAQELVDGKGIIEHFSA
jgi:hypothetical protein